MSTFAKKIDEVFNFGSNQVRVVVDEKGMPWFYAGDVCDILGFSNPRDALLNHVDSEDVAKYDTLILEPKGRKQTQKVNYVNESGLYSLIFGSKKPEAKPFKHWVFTEVLPSIRRTGEYSLTDKLGNSATWVEARDNGKAIRKMFTDVIKDTGHLTAMDIARATNCTYKAVTGHVADVLKVILDTKVIRDKLSKTTLDTLKSIEYATAVVVQGKVITSGQEYVDVVKTVSEHQMELFDKLFGAKALLAIKDNRVLLLDGRVAYTPTELLKRFDLGISVVKFNKLMRSSGKLEMRQRPSTSNPGEFKDYEALVDTNYGINEQKFKSGKLVGYQVKYFEDTFVDLVESIS